MARNPNVTDLDLSQVVKRVINPEDDAVRVDLVNGVAMEIELSAEDGDSVISYSDNITIEGKLESSEQIELDVSKYSKASLYLKSNTEIQLLPVVSLKVSPVLIGNIWAASGLQASPRPTNEVSMAGPVAILAKRVKLELSSKLAEGESVSYFLVLGS